MRILLTGGTGFIGRHVMRRLGPDHDVLAIARGDGAIDGADEVIRADLRDPQVERVLPPRVDAVIHLAQAYLPPDRVGEIEAVNVGSTRTLAAYAAKAGARAFVFTSTGGVYAPSRAPLREDSPTNPVDVRFATKLRAEEELRLEARGVDIRILRLFFPYGPGQADRMIPRIAASVAAGRPIPLSRGGEPRVNPIHVDDVVRIISGALGLHGDHLVNVAGPDVVSIRELATLLGELLGREPRFEDRTQDRPGDLVADTSLMHALFAPRALIGLREGLGHVVSASVARA